MPDFHGVFPYLVSPVDANGQIRTEVLGRLCDDLIKSGVHGLTPLGSTGEFAYLNNEQRIARGAGHHRGRAKGAYPWWPASPRPRQRMRWRRRRPIRRWAPTASWRFCEAYFPLSDAQVESYFRAIADAVDIPVVIYTNPQFQRSRSHARCDRAARRASAHPLHQGCLHQYRTAAVDHEPLRRRHQGVLGLRAYPGRGDADRRRRLDGRDRPASFRARASSSTISAGPRTGTRRWRCSGGCGGSTRPSRASTSPPASRPGSRSRATTSAIPLPPQAALTAEERKAVEAVLRESGYGRHSGRCEASSSESWNPRSAIAHLRPGPSDHPGMTAEWGLACTLQID